MSDTAAFFAKKKTKKKKFKAFNANKIDASAVTTSTHVDAPEISAETVTTSLGGLGGLGAGSGAEGGGGDDQWADSAGGWGSSNKAPAATAGNSKVAELLDMQALSAKRDEQDDVAERLRIEETKAKLARAKEGMAKEAERLTAEKEVKAAARSGGGGMAGGAAGGLSALGGGVASGKWVPSHMRSAGAANGGSRFGMAGSGVRGPASMDSAGFQKPVDMANEELFPDLAAADKILEEKEKQEKAEQERMATGQPATAPAGWGLRMGPAAAASVQRKPLNLAKPAERKLLNVASLKKTEEEPEPTKEEETKEETNPAPEPAALAPAPAVAKTKTEAPVAAPAPEKPVEEKPKKKVLKKKKKKDLSTFKIKS